MYCSLFSGYSRNYIDFKQFSNKPNRFFCLIRNITRNMCHPPVKLKLVGRSKKDRILATKCSKWVRFEIWSCWTNVQLVLCVSPSQNYFPFFHISRVFHSYLDTNLFLMPAVCVIAQRCYGCLISFSTFFDETLVRGLIAEGVYD